MKKLSLIVLLLLLVVCCTHAHTINYQLDKAPADSFFTVVFKYLWIGFTHIIPEGFDHILFIMCVFFLNTSLKKIILQASMFTLAHSITLGLAIYGIITPPTNVVEPLIAFSIVFLALENVFSNKVKPWRMLMVFLFGMVHGMGFATALRDMGMPQDSFATALISFNVGVEIGQLCIILFMYFFIARIFAGKVWYRRRIVIPASLMIAIVAGYWTVERILHPGV